MEKGKERFAFWLGSLELPAYKKWGILLLLLIAAVIQLFRMESLKHNPQKAVDFRNIYIGSVLVSEGQNPYNDTAIKSTWIAIQRKEHLPENIAPGLPTLALLYPPLTLFIGSSFTILTYQNAVFVFKLILLLQLLVFPWLLARWFRSLGINIGIIPLFLLLLATKPVINMVNVGQPSLLVVNLLLLAMCLVAENKYNWRLHLLLFFGMLKPTIGGIIGSFYVHRWRKMALAAAVIGASFFPFVVINKAALPGYLSQAKGQISAAYNPNSAEFPYSFEAMSNTQVESVLALFHLTGEIAMVVKIFLLLLFAVVYLAMRKPDNSGFSWLLPMVLLSLVFGYHKYYDLLLMLPFCVLAVLRGNITMRVLGLWLLVHLLLPYKVLAFAGLPTHWVDLLQFQNSIIPLVWLIALSMKPQMFRYPLV